MITQDRLKEVIKYDPESGVFTRIKCRGNTRLIGKPAGWHRDGNHSSIRVDGVLYRLHRLAFLYMTGTMPEYVDHINGIRGDNRWSNLREATLSQNSHNRKINSNSTSGVKGVSWHKRIGKWYVRVMVNNRQMGFGYWDDLEAAELVAQLAREKYHGEYSNHGKSSLRED